MEIPVVDYLSPVQLDWQNRQLSELRNAALLAKPVVDNGGSMAVIGTPDEVEKVLRAAFTMVEDPESRAGMTFTTNGDNCELVPGRFWAIGYCNRPRRDFPAVVDTAEKRVVKMPSGGGERGTTLFATWLESALQSTDGRPLAARIPTVRILAEAVDQGTKVSDTAVLDELAVEEFAEFGRDQLIDRLAKELAPSLDADLARILASWMANNHLYPSALVRASLFDIAQPKARLAEWLERYLVALPSLAIRPKLTSWWSIRRFASSNQLPALSFLANALSPWLVVAWWRSGNCRRALQGLPQREYQQLLEKMTPAVSPVLFVAGGKEPLLLRRCEELTLSDAELSSLLDSLIRYGEAFSLIEPLRKRIIDLPRRSRRRLLRLVDKNPRHLKALEAPLLEADALTDRDASERLAFSRRLDGISGAGRRPDLDAQTQH